MKKRKTFWYAIGPKNIYIEMICKVKNHLSGFIESIPTRKYIKTSFENIKKGRMNAYSHEFNLKQLTILIMMIIIFV